VASVSADALVPFDLGALLAIRGGAATSSAGVRASVPGDLGLTLRVAISLILSS